MSRVSQKDLDNAMKDLIKAVEESRDTWYTKEEVIRIAKVNSDQFSAFEISHKYLCKIENGVTYYSYDFICGITDVYDNTDISEYL